jgi:hypothetical protein
MASRVSYKFKRLPEGEEKLTPQALTILKVLQDRFDEDEVVSRDRLVDVLAEKKDPDSDTPSSDGNNILGARQPVERVLAFYQKRLVEDGYVELIKPEPEKKEPAAKKAKGKTKVQTDDEREESDEDPEATRESLKVE